MFFAYEFIKEDKSVSLHFNASYSDTIILVRICIAVKRIDSDLMLYMLYRRKVAGEEEYVARNENCRVSHRKARERLEDGRGHHVFVGVQLVSVKIVC